MLAFASLLAPQPTQAQGTGFYVRGDIGPAFTENMQVTEFFGAVSGATIKLDPGVRFGAAGGYSITDWFAAEVETGVSYNYFRSVSGNFTADNTSLANVPFLGNLVLQCPTKLGIVPYVGGGLGVVFSTFDTDYFSDNSRNAVEGTDTDAVFAYQGFAGLRYKINERMFVDLGYKYLRAEAPRYHVEPLFFGGASGDLRLSAIHTHSVAFSFTIQF
jgi:opacity protein-like surface antigen